MMAVLRQAGYILDRANNIWISPSYAGITYSDGNEIEMRIASVIQMASDISVLSTELRQHCTDWPSLYHLSGTRANIMRPFENLLKGDVLEIGAGCGAITRYLGECGANVLALEGSPRRAAIARSRTRDLKNITVLAEKFEDFECNRQFDVITLIGVLEYANLFASGDNPPLSMLAQVRSMLKPEGQLIIAIENQLGLKYFAGAPEDHLGQPMLGIEGRYRKNQPQTFGRKVMTAMLEQAGFSRNEFLAPFPDYKLPVSILTENGINFVGFNPAAFAWQSARRDPQLPVHCNFSLELTWPEIFNNGMSLDVTNSFLIISSPTEKKHIDTDILAYHYSTDRVSKYCKETRFERSERNVVEVVYERLGVSYQNSQIDDGEVIDFRCPTTAMYVNANTMSWEFIEIVTRDAWTIEEVGHFFRRYISILQNMLAEDGFILSLGSPEVRLPGNCFDLGPQNIVQGIDGKHVAIDTEWALRDEVELGHLLFRSLLLMMNSVTRFGQNSTGKLFSRIEFVQSVFASIGFALTEREFSRFIDIEANIQKQITGRPASEFLAWWPNEPLPAQNPSQVISAREQEIDTARQTINGLAAEIEAARRSHAIRDETEQRLRESLAAHEQEIDTARETINGLAAEIEAARRSHAIRDETEQRLRESLAQRNDELERIRGKFAFQLLAKLRML